VNKMLVTGPSCMQKQYFAGGRFIDQTGEGRLSKIEISTFFFQHVLSQMMNSKWIEDGRTYILCTNDTGFAFKGELARAIYDVNRTSGCALYSEKDYVKTGLGNLRNETYNIPVDSIIASSVGAYAFAKFNFTDNKSAELLQYSTNLDPEQQPWRQKVRWPGTWTIPVCDLSSNIQVKDNLTLPCCCGTNCGETIDFIKRAKLSNFNGKDVCQKAFPKQSYNSAPGQQVPLSAVLLFATVIALFVI